MMLLAVCAHLLLIVCGMQFSQQPLLAAGTTTAILAVNTTFVCDVHVDCVLRLPLPLRQATWLLSQFTL